jgi:spore coat polysaccharide biosynthesis protein SpsF (cytidylyltransferase family)
VDPDYADRAVQYHLQVNAEYSDLKALPGGTEVEVFDADLLHAIWNAAHDCGGTEYLTDYITSHGDQFRTAKVPVDENHARPWCLTLDTPEDCEVIQAFLQAMRRRGKLLSYRLDDIVEFFHSHQKLLSINEKVRQPQTPPSICTDLDWKKLT